MSFHSNCVLDTAPSTTMGVPKYINSIMCLPFSNWSYYGWANMVTSSKRKQ